METKEKLSLKEGVAFFIQRFRIPLLGLLGLLVIGIIVAVVMEEVQKSNLASTTAIIEDLETAYEKINSAKDETEKKVSQSTFDAVAAKIEASYTGTFAMQRADYLRGNLQFSAKDFAAAELSFQKAEKDFSAGYLSPIALMNAAISAEVGGNLTKAQTYLSEIVQHNNQSSPMVVRAYLNLGRLAEGEKKWSTARDAYQKILDGYNSSNWTKLARDRIIFLKAQGLL